MTTKNIHGEGGGCFIPGTKISTPRGPRPIEEIKPGDEVYAYSIATLEPGALNLPGSVTIRRVLATFSHAWREVSTTSPPLTIEHERGVLNTTGNHYILTSARRETPEPGFLRADQLKVGDELFTRYGEVSRVTNIVRGQRYATVHNLEVDVDHTYIADGIRVHNGGGGKGDRNPVQAENTIYTNQVAAVLLCPTEGPSAGLWDVFVNGGYGSAGDTLENRSKSVYLGGRPLINSSNQYEFTNISVEQRIGLPSQEIIPGFSTTESEVVAGLPIAVTKAQFQFRGTKAKISDLPTVGNAINDVWRVTEENRNYSWRGDRWAPTSGQGAVALSPSSGVISSPIERAIDAVRVTIEFPNGLQRADPKTGDTGATDVELRISRRISGGAWESALVRTIKEMSSGTFLWTAEIRRPILTGPWEFRVERLTDDSTSNYVRDDFRLRSYTLIQETKYNDDGSILFEPRYNDRALIGIQLGADSTNGQVPTISLDFGGVLVQVPDNYTTRLYDKSWQITRNAEYSSLGWGQTFKPLREWTDNPAWLLYDLLTNDRYGLGNNDSTQFRIDPAIIDKSSFYAAARYCDELIDDGLGTDTSEPRFTFNGQLMVREDAWRTLQAFASSFNAKLYMHGGMIRLTQDRPEPVTKIINNTTVVNGQFNYAYSPSTERYSQCNATFNDPRDSFLPKVVSHTDDAGLDRYGLQPINLIAYGAATEGQARRAAKWAVYTSLNTTAVITFGVSIANSDLEPGQVIKVLDFDYAQAYQEGAVVSVDGTTVTLDTPFTKGVGTWTIDFLGADGVSIETRTIVSSSTPTITIDAPTSALPGSPYIITGTATDVAPMLYRVVSMLDAEEGIYSVTAVQYDPHKYNFIELGIEVPPAIYYQQPRLVSISAPRDITVQETAAANPDGIVFRRLEISWLPPLDNTAVGYRLQWRKDGGALQTLQTATPFAQISADIDGEYEIYINAVNAAGVTSPTASYRHTVTTAVSDNSLLAPPANLRELTHGGSIFTTSDLAVEWHNPPGNTAIKYFDVRLLDGETLLRAERVAAVGPGQTATYTYTYGNNVTDGGPRRTVRVQVRIVDLQNRMTLPAERTFTNPPPAVPQNISIQAGFGNNFIKYRLPTDADFEGVLVWASTESDFILSEEMLIRDGVDTFFPHTGVEPNTTYYYRFASYDSFSKDYSGQSLNITAAFTIVSANIDFDINKLQNSSFELLQETLFTWSPGLGNAINRPLFWIGMHGDSSGIIYTENTGRNSPNAVGVQARLATTAPFGIRTFPEEKGGAVGGYTVGKTYVISIWARKKSGLAAAAGLDLVFTDDYPATLKEELLNPPLTTEWQRYAWVCRWDYTAASDGRADFVVVTPSVAIGDEVVFDDAQIEQGDVLTDYAPRVGELGPGSITETLIAPGSVTTPKIAATSILGYHIMGDTITGNHIQSDSVTADKIAVNELSAITGNLGEIYTGYLHGTTISGGAFTQAHAWPATGTGYQLSSDGLLFGNYNTGPFFQITHDANVYSNQFMIENGNAFFSGQLAAASGTFAGQLQAASGTFAGDISAATGHFTGEVEIRDASVTTLKIAGRAVTLPRSAYSAGYSATVYMWVPPEATGAREFIVPAGVTQLTVTSIGAGGGGGGFWGDGDDHPGGGGGCGGINTQTLAVTPGEKLFIFVGVGGTAAGFSFERSIFCAGNGTGFGGNGGSTFISRSTAPSVRLVEATGGYGGNGAWSDNAAPIDANHDNGSGNNGTPGTFPHAPGEPSPPSNGTDSNRRHYYSIPGASNGTGYGAGGNGQHHDIGGINLICSTPGQDGHVTLSWAGGAALYEALTTETQSVAVISASVAVPRGGYNQQLLVKKPSGDYAIVREESVATGTVPALFYQALIDEPGTWHFQVKSTDIWQGARAFVSVLITLR